MLRIKLKLVSLLALVLITLGSFSAKATVYIKEVAVSGAPNGNSNEAIQHLKEQGYTPLDVDLNKGAGGWDIFIGYKTTDNYEEAITNLLILNGSDYVKQDYIASYSKSSFRKCKVLGSEFNGDLNRGSSGSSDLFLYYTTDDPENDLLTKCGKGVLSGLSVEWYENEQPENAFVRMVDKGNNFFNPDCNRKAGGKYVYIRQTKTYYKGNSNLFVDDFKVTHLGGKLYEFTLPLARVANTNKLSYWLNKNSSATVYMSINGEDKRLFSLYNNESSGYDDYAKDWDIQLVRGTGAFYDFATMNRRGNNYNWHTMGGNSTDRKVVKVLWEADDETEKAAGQFTYKATMINKNTERYGDKIDVKLMTTASKPTSSVSDLFVTTPIIDSENSLPGRSLLYVTATSPIKTCMVWDATSNKVVMTQDLTSSDDTKTFSLSLPPNDETHELSVIVYGEKNNYNSTGQQEKTLDVFTASVKQQPFHRLVNASTGMLVCNKDDRGIAQRYPRLEWQIHSPRADDLLTGDRIIVERSRTTDYTDGQTLTTFEFTDTAKTVEKDGKLMGQFMLTDNTQTYSKEDEVKEVYYWERYNIPSYLVTADWVAMINKSRFQAHVTHYRAYRAVVNSVWANELENSDYQAKWETTSFNILPFVSKISVEQMPDWEETKHVRLHIQLDNPYPWEYGNPYQNMRNALKKQAIELGDTARMFLWDSEASIRIERYSPKNDYFEGKDDAAHTIIVNGNAVKWDNENGCYYVDVDDYQTLPYLHYYYKATVDNSSRNQPIFDKLNLGTHTTKGEADSSYSESMAPIAPFTATQGTGIGKVDLQWELGDGLEPTLTLWRYTLKATADGKNATPDMTTEKEIAIQTNGIATDTDVNVGEVYLYTLKGELIYRGNTYEMSSSQVGYPSRYGTISGRVQMSNGSNVPGYAKVNVERLKRNNTTVIEFPEINYSTKYLKVNVPAVQHEAFNKTVNVANDGTYVLENVPYDYKGWEYQVTPVYGTLVFGNIQGTNSPVELTLSNAHGEHKNIDFTLNNTRHFSGRVLYENSTMPVSGVQFLVNGEKVMTAQKDTLVTDAMGNFSFLVPNTAITVQAYKENHVLTDKGFIFGTPEEPKLPAHDMELLEICDSTKVRLVGRIVGGDRQGAKPVGMGLSQNNLGDSITVVLQLEGNNTSYTYYNSEEPDVTSQQSRFTQRVNDGTDDLDVNATVVNFERKRIVITMPSTEAERGTGEFCVDLAPAKYKIVQMYAKGYSSFFNTNEGYQILDLTDSIHSKTVSSTIDDKTYTTQYHAAYNRVYHAPLTVNMTQKLYGRTTPYFGENVLSSYVYVSNEARDTTQLVTDRMMNLYDAAQGKYLLGHPVFEGGKSYTLALEAKEYYHYNNSKTSSYTETVAHACDLSVKNGLVDDKQATTTIHLNDNGEGTLIFTPKNTTFKLTGEDALRTLALYADVNGMQYETNALRAYVTGNRTKSTMVLAEAKDVEIMLADVLRDPPGSGSSAYREKGTKYEWSYTNSKKISMDLAIDMAGGYTLKTSTGVGFAVSSEFTSTVPLPSVSVNMGTETWKNASSYTLTLNDRITTSSAVYDEGAMADVYIGTATSYKMQAIERMCIIDKNTYEQNAERFKSGEFKVITQSGDSIYLVIGEGVGVSPDKLTSFAYSHRYILGTLIPQLQQTGNYLGVNAWKKVLESNEEEKYKCYVEQNNNVLTTERKAFAGTTIAHTEAASSYTVSAHNFYFGGASVGLKVGGSNKSTEAGKYTDNATHDEVTKEQANNNNNNAFTLKVPGAYFSLSVGVKGSPTFTITDDYKKTYSAGTGYTLVDGTGSNYVVDIYGLKAGDLTSNISMSEDNRNNKEGKDDVQDAQMHSYVFVTRGGSKRSPWLAPDTTHVYKLNGKSVQLGDPTLKIDNPKIYIEQPVRNNVPLNGKAVFTLHLSNESEVPNATSYIKPAGFVLKVVDGTNPNGLKITIDGQVLTSGRTFGFLPGESLTKTMVVERGQGYDYDDVTLQFLDESKSLIDKATFSVHFQRESSPVTITQPAQNWVLNTLSQTEDGRYYKPVKITGFDTNYDNFDHVELQYKRYTDDESQWTTLAAYYPDTQEFDSIYNAATGNKARMESGTIPEIRFFGENDPEEMKYDLRAVTFCRQGTGYVSRASEVVSGTKDTRRPEVFGKAKPTSGILTYEDVIALPFNEPIAYNYLDKTANFDVRGYVNSGNTDQQTSLYMDGAKSLAQTSVNRNMHGRSFTVDMMAQIANDDQIMHMLYFQEGDTLHKEASVHFLLLKYDFGERQGQILSANIKNKSYVSRDLPASEYDLTQGMHHLGMTYDNETENVVFMVDGVELPATTEDITQENEAYILPNGKITIGYDCPENEYKELVDNVLRPRMNVMDVRLWSRALTLREFVNKAGKRLSADERGLMAYWPMDETRGNVARDIVGGADLQLSGTQWHYPDGFSLKLNGKGVGLSNVDKMHRTENEDYTLSLWFKADEKPDGKANLLAAGDDDLDEKLRGKMRIQLNDEQLTLRTNDSAFVFTDQVSMGEWHQLGVVTNHSQGSAALYYDGQLVGQYDGELFDGIATDTISLGGGFKGNIDDLTFYHIALPASYIKKSYCRLPLGTESELAVFLPFEQDKRMPDNSIEPTFSPYNMTLGEDGKFSKNEVLKDYEFSNETAPLAPNTGMQRIDFNWTSNDNELQINLLKHDYELNGQEVNIVVRGVEDNYGNVMENPQMWTVYYDRNVLQWDEPKAELTLPYGYSASLQTSWTNHSGKTLSYTIETDAPWLSISDTKGIVDPLEQMDLTITVSDGLRPREYNANIYLTDENHLMAKLPVTIVVQAIEPEWKVTDNVDYNMSMNLKGQVKLGNMIDTDARDKVAAFCNGICVGLANITADVAKNTGYVYMNILGTTSMNSSNAPLNFYLWDAASGNINALNAEPDVKFVANTYIGTPPSEPVLFTKSNKQIQLIEVEKGWNWVSLNVKPNTDKAINVNNLFVNNNAFTLGDRIKTFNSGFAEFNGKQWVGSSLNLNNAHERIFQIYMNEPATLEVLGDEMTSNTWEVKLHNKGESSWNELPYYPSYAQSIGTALANYLPGDAEIAPVGTIIKSRTQFAVADNGKWDGSLKTMRPGVGYYVKHYGATDFTLQYGNSPIADPKKSKSAPAKAPATRSASASALITATRSTALSDDATSANASASALITATRSAALSDDATASALTATPCAPSSTKESKESPHNMPVIAAMAPGKECREGDVLLAYTRGAIVGEAELSLSEHGDREPLFFLSVNASSGDAIRFALLRDGEVLSVGSQVLQYQPTAVIGTLLKPYLITDDADQASDADLLYDLLGRRIAKDAVSPRGVVVKGNKKFIKK